jgi:hypothetical protein
VAKVERNDSNEIIDHDGRPLGIIAAYHVARARRTTKKAEDAERAHTMSARQFGLADGRTYDAEFKWSDAENKRDAEMWRSHRYSQQNVDAMRQQALEEATAAGAQVDLAQPASEIPQDVPPPPQQSALEHGQRQ